jgi:ElaB/YqjD/DUF883 family membrane-anchored ribosome-binding protein
MADTEEQARGNGASGDTPAPRASRRASAAYEGGARKARVSHEVEAEAGSLEEQVAQLQSDLRSITNTLTRMGHTAGDELKSTARARADQLAARGQSAIDSAQDEFGQIERQIKDTIREKPLTAVAGAVALGFLIAVLTR